MTKFELEIARKRIVKFSEKYAGVDLKISDLSDIELYSYILADTYFNIDALLGFDADVSLVLTRAIQKAEQIKKNGLSKYRLENKDLVTRIM